MPKHRRIYGFKKIDTDRNFVDDRLDWITNVCSVVLPFTTLHQVYLIYVQRETAGVSGLTWLLYAILSVPLFIYSLQRKDTPMIILNGLWVFFDTLVWFGVVLYG